jgi:hypothetical protein
MKNKFNRNVWYEEELADGLGTLTFEELEKIATAPSARVDIHQSGSIDITVDRIFNKQVHLVVKSQGLLPHRPQNAITLRAGDKMFFNPSTNGLWKITENPFSKKPNTDLDPFEQIGEQYGIRKNKFFTTEKNETIIIPKQFRIAEKISQTGEKDIIIAFDNIYKINGNYDAGFLSPTSFGIAIAIAIFNKEAPMIALIIAFLSAVPVQADSLVPMECIASNRDGVRVVGRGRGLSGSRARCACAGRRARARRRGRRRASPTCPRRPAG